jgi:hypothetical protein
MSSRKRHRTRPVLGAGGARGDKACPIVAIDLITDLLLRRPRRPMGRWKVKSDSPETISGTQVGDFDAHLPPSHVAWHLAHGRHANLSERPVPLSPRGPLFLGEVKALDDVTVLPPIVRSRIGSAREPGPMRNVTPPDTADVRPSTSSVTDQLAPGLSRLEMMRATSRYLPAAIRLIGLSSPSAGTGLRSQTGI